LVVRIVGVGPQTDSYIAAQAVPVVLGAVVIAALQSVWMPRLAVLTCSIGEWRRQQAVAQGHAAILSVGLLLVLGVGVGWWLPWCYPGLSEQQQQDAMGFTFVLLGATGFTTQSALLTVALRARDRFVAPELIATVGAAFALVATYLALPHWGVDAAVWIALTRSVLVYLAQMWIAGWPALSLRDGWRSGSEWRQMRPLLFGTSIYKTSPVIDRYWASQAPAGAITVLALANTAITSAATVLDRALGIPLVPTLSRLVAEGQYE
ncbi:lipid II flippase MurJ, partial [Leptospira sp. SA-E8]|uniref:lipid II flippase MurJ n=1 Tax=Leptospira sp. SA-E8 TaxID=3422259 RepID=UPI003EB6DE03